MIEICCCDEDEMITITRDGVSVFNGNYWDLPTSATQLDDFLNKLGLETTLVEEVRGEFQEEDEED